MAERERDFYAALGIRPSANSSEIKSAFRKAVLMVHPDKRAGEDMDSPEFHLLKRAHDVLIDDRLREIYDKLGEKGLELVDNLNSTAIIKKTYTLDQLYYKLRKVQHVSKLNWFTENVAQQNLVEISTGIWDLIDVIRFKRPLESASMTISSSSRIPMPAAHHLRLGATMNYTNAEEYGSLSTYFLGQYEYTLSHLGSVFAKVKYGHPYPVRIGWYRLLNDLTRMRQSLVYDVQAHWWNMTVTLERALQFFNTDCLGIVDVGIGYNHFMQARLQDSERRWTLIADSRRNSPLVGALELRKEMEEKWFLGGGGRYSVLGSWELSALVGFVISKLSTFELSLSFGSEGVGITLQFSRWGQVFRFPLTISPQLSILNAAASAIYSMVVAFLFQYLIFRPMVRAKAAEKLRLKRATLDEERSNAEKFVEGMRLSIDAKRKEEEEKGGLVIIHASYGNLSKRSNFVGPTQNVSVDLEELPEEEEDDPEILQVADQLQFLVENSELHLTEAHKYDLPGIHDPCTGQPNYLEIYYFFGGNLHYVMIGDTDELHLPLKAHKK